jgi:hypothetical protein
VTKDKVTTASEIFALILKLHAKQPDGFVVSIGHWNSDMFKEAWEPEFVPDIRLTLGEVRALTDIKAV